MSRCHQKHLQISCIEIQTSEKFIGCRYKHRVVTDINYFRWGWKNTKKTQHDFALFCPYKCNIMAEGFCFMLLGLVRLRTFRLSAWVSLVQTWAQVLTCTWGGCVVHRCQNKNPRERIRPGDVNDIMHRKRARRILGILKKSFGLSPASEEDGWLLLARRSQASGLVAGATHVGGQMEKPA